MSGGEPQALAAEAYGMLCDLLPSLRTSRYMEVLAWLKELKDFVQAPVFDEHGCFVGHEPRECGEHRTVGDHRAWCHDCSEWCYPRIPCNGCEIIGLRPS